MPTYRKTPLLSHLRNHWELLIFLLPALTLVICFCYGPMVGVQIAFRDFSATKGMWGSNWVGLKHFERMMTLPTLWPMIRNTLTISALSILLGFPMPVIFALMLNQIRRERFKRMLQTITYLPHFISTVVVVGMMLVFFSPRTGLYGNLARLVGVADPPHILGMAHNFKWFYVLSDVWQHTGWNSIIYLAALSAIDPALYEAAIIDGANKWQRLVHIDVPSIMPTMVILIILSSGSILNVGFEKVFLMQNGSNAGVSEVISTYVYKIGIQKSNQFSFATAIGLANTLVNFVFLVAVNMISRRLGDVSLW